MGNHSSERAVDGPVDEQAQSPVPEKLDGFGFIRVPGRGLAGRYAGEEGGSEVADHQAMISLSAGGGVLLWSQAA